MNGNPTVKIPPLTAIATLKLSLQLVFRAAGRYLWPLFIFSMLTGISPSLSLYLNKEIINTIIGLERGPDLPIQETLFNPGAVLLWLVLGIVALNFVLDAFKSINSFLTGAVRDQVNGYVTLALIQKISTFPHISLFENSELLNLIKLAEKGIRKTEEFTFILILGIGGLSILIPAILFSLTITWWVPLVLFVATAPSIYIEGYYREKSWDVEQSQAYNSRMMDIQAMILTQQSYAKELRLLRLQSLLTARWQEYFQEMFQALQKIRKRGTISIVGWSILNSIGLMVPYFFLIRGVLRQDYTLGDLALYGGLILQVRQGLSILINNGSELYDIVLGITPIHQILKLEAGKEQSNNNPVIEAEKLPSFIHDNRPPKTTNKSPHQGIEFRHVSFIYPGSQIPIINQCDLKIKPGEIIALVGENGAGKSTLVKLLCQFYAVTNGEILWDGVNINELSYEELYHRITVIFQDYAQFPVNLRENIAFANPDLLHDGDRQIHKILDRIGFPLASRSLPLGLDTPLGKQLENGVELSGGQWQRVAIARALSRMEQTELIIFDEPTAALDSYAEESMFQAFRKIAKDKMSIVISHRLALCRLADRIVVMEQGQIIESGSHAELMEQQGRYFKMFSLQAAHYR